MEKVLFVRSGNFIEDDYGYLYEERVPELRTVARFRQISTELATQLLAFTHRNNLGKSIVIDGKEYTLDFISENHGRRGRGLSIYFRVGRSIIRISDHWSETNHHPRSRKLNCGQIDNAYWVLDDKDSSTIKSTYHTRRFPWVLKAGICGKSVLNKTVDHWK